MGRIKEFDMDIALEKALGVFWEKGYEATSLSDLTDGMGIQRASLYGAFGSKYELFESAILQYQRESLVALEATVLAPGEPIETLRSILTSAIPEAGQSRKGCFCVNAAIESAQHLPEITRILEAHEMKVKALLARLVATGQAQGVFAISISPMEGAAYLLSSLYGLHVSAKTTCHPESLNRTIDLILKGIQV
jgi:TetR/AcrR family transcriptional regulator, transcriptional repressor for nem operon